MYCVMAWTHQRRCCVGKKWTGVKNELCPVVFVNCLIVLINWYGTALFQHPYNTFVHSRRNDLIWGNCLMIPAMELHYFLSACFVKSLWVNNNKGTLMCGLNVPVSLLKTGLCNFSAKNEPQLQHEPIFISKSRLKSCLVLTGIRGLTF